MATAVVLAFAFFPNYVGYLLGNGDPHALATMPGSGGARMFRVEGMTCAACAVTLRDRLGKVPGVARAEVSFEEMTAHVFFGEGQPRPSDETLLGAIREGGYTGAVVESTRTVRIAVRGMTCAGCAAGLAMRLRELAGVHAAAVDYEAGSAAVTLARNGQVAVILQAIAEQGFEGRAIPEADPDVLGAGAPSR